MFYMDVTQTQRAQLFGSKFWRIKVNPKIGTKIIIENEPLRMRFSNE
jgi:hypothetical protein